MKTLLNILKWPFSKFASFGKRGRITTIIILALIIYWRYTAYVNSGLEVAVTEAKRGNLTESVSASGKINADQKATLTFKTIGKVVEVNYKEGDLVKKDDVIAKMETTELFATYKQADAGLRAAQAELNRIYDTLQGKEKSETFSEISARTQAETTKDRAYWAYVAASNALSGSYVKAPFDGILTKAPENLAEGSVLSVPTAGVFEVTAPETIYFDAEINESDVPKVTEGAKATISIDAFPENKFEGTVESLAYSSKTTSTGGTAYKIRLSIGGGETKNLRVGMNGDAEIILSEKEDVLLVPMTSVIENGDNNFVWISEGEKAKQVKVETGVSSIDEIEIVSGLNGGELVITRPPSTIIEGAKLKIKS